MKPALPILILLFLSLNTSAQKQSNFFNLSAGPSWHGTGDLRGFGFDVMYVHFYSKRFSFSNGIGTTIHYGKDKGFNGYSPGASPDKSLMRHTTAGIQFNSMADFAFILLPYLKVQVSAGAILRYQSSSYPSLFGYVQDTRFYPEPFYVFDNRDKQNTFSPGYAVGFTLLTKLSQKYQAGIKTFFQNDNKGDVLTSISFIVGRILPDMK